MILKECDMYQALYRKYRPQTFDDVIGQNHITQALKTQVQSGRLSHAYLFVGTRGTGKTTCARILAKAVNCEHPVNGDPCCQCESCRSILSGESMDIVELDAASNNGVDNVRVLREEAVFSPANAKKRVYIIDEVHMLSTPAFNALLKILEEPPEHLIFILATTEIQKVPATILSRCQRHSFRRIDTPVLAGYLESIAQKEGFGLTREAAELIAGLGEGSVRDAMSMLDQCSTFGSIDVNEVYASVGLAGNQRTANLLSEIIRRDADSALTDFNQLWQEGKDPAVLFRELSNLCRDALMVKVAPKNAASFVYGGYEMSVLSEIAASTDVAHLNWILSGLQDALSSMRDKINPRISAEIFLVSACQAPESAVPAPSVPAVPAAAPAPAAEKQMPAPAPAERPVSPAAAEAPAPKAPAAAPVMPAVPAEESKIPAAAPEVPSEKKDDTTWREILDRAKASLPRDMQSFLSGVDGELNGSALTLYFSNSFYLMRFNRPEIIEIIERSGRELTGAPVRLSLKEVKKTIEARGSLSELSQFSEVRFI